MRNEPMTMAQVRRHHRWRFAIALATCVWLAVVALVCLRGLANAPAPSPVDYAVTIAAAVATVYFGRVARRRWRRLYEFSLWRQ